MAFGTGICQKLSFLILQFLARRIMGNSLSQFVSYQRQDAINQANDTERQGGLLEGSTTYFGPQFVFQGRNTAGDAAGRAYFDEVLNILSSPSSLAAEVMRPTVCPS